MRSNLIMLMPLLLEVRQAIRILPLDQRKKKFSEEDLQLHVPPEFQAEYIQMVLKYHDFLSQANFDPRATVQILHKVTTSPMTSLCM
jgi:hypothetical protein